MMFWSCWRWPSALVRRIGTGRARVRQRPGMFHVEGLESRELLTSFVVNSLGDTSDQGTLRWAIEQANSSAGADSISFDSTVFNTERSITLQGTQLPTFTDVTGTTTINGPGWGLLAVSSSYNSRVFEVASGVTVAINDLTISRGKLTDQNGGAVLSNGTLTLTNTHVTDSSAVSGGAIYSGPGTVLKLINSAVIHNSATGDGGAIFNAGILSIVDSTLNQNDAQNGGAIATGPVAEVLTISGSTFQQNTASDRGGAILNTGSILKIVDSQLFANEAKLGGAITNFDGATLVLSSSTVQGNHATNYGGGILNLGGGLLNVGGEGTDPSTLTISDSTIQGNSSGLQGGGIYSEGNVFLTTSNVISNVTQDDGGGIRSWGTLTVLRSQFTNNVSHNSGGAVLSSGSTSVNDSTFDGNSADWNGGAIAGDNLSVADSTFTNNTASQGSGGGIVTGNSTVVTSSVFSGNTAKYGGGYSGGGSISTSTFSENSAQFGGGVSQSGGVITLTDTTIANNAATVDGGGVYNFADGRTELIRSTIHGNTADDGGGVFIEVNGECSIFESIIDGNSATTGGGIEINYHTDLLLSNSTVSNNSATQGGGLDNAGRARIFNSTFSGNSADLGGAIYHRDRFGLPADLTIVNVTIADNHAQVAGGGLFQATDPETVFLGNVLLARNDRGSDADDIFGTIDVSRSTHNLIGPGGAGGLVQGVNGNRVLASNAMLGLGPLGMHGGPTPTMLLLYGSPAIDAGTSDLSIEYPIAFDQRGNGRSWGGEYDVGAVESFFTVSSASPAENQLAVMTVHALGIETQPLTFSLTGGADQALFAIDTATGELTFLAPPDFEHPGDADADNVYHAQVTIADSDGGFGVQDITVNVQNVVEDLALTVSSDPGTYQIRGAAVVDADADLHADGAITNYSSAQLVVSISANRDPKDLLKIASQGKDAGQISVKQNKILFGGVVIGTLAGGTKAMPNLVITFNSAATEAAVDALLKRISFSTKNSRLPQLTRTLQMQLTNLAGGATNVATRQINVVARS